MLKSKPIIWSILLSLAIATVIVGISSIGMFDRLEWMSYDWRMKRTNQNKTVPDDIAIVMIDEASLKYMNNEAGRWPWPRSVHANLLDFISKGEPRAILFDILFSENQMSIAEQIERGNENDERLVEATSDAGMIFHAMQLRKEIQDENATVLTMPTLPESFTSRFSLSSGEAANPDEARNTTFKPEKMSAIPSLGLNTFDIPFTNLYLASKGMGVVKAEPDSDGVYRRNTLFFPYGNSIFPSLPMASLMDTLKPKSIRFESHGLKIGDQFIPIDERGKYLINFYKNYNVYSYGGIISSWKKLDSGDIENLKIHPSEFENKIVFIGASAVGVEDLKITPMSPTDPGVYIHASIAGNILTNDFNRPIAAWAANFNIYILSLLVGVCVFGFRSVIVKVFLPISIFTVYVYLCILQFNAEVIMNMVTPIVSAILTWLLSFSYLLFYESKDKKKVRTMLSQYVSPAVLTEVVDKYENYLTAEVGRNERVTIFFSDIRGFTDMSESQSAEQVVDILNIYFSSVTNSIFEHKGTIDKFIGDATMAFWGAPIKTQDHALEAIRASLDMLNNLPKINELLHAKNYPALRIGIGINTGTVVLGNIGSEKKLDYTVIGDNVNLASRLEGLTKRYQLQIIISEYTYEEIKEQIPCRVVDFVRVKGKKHPIKIYTPVLMESSNEDNRISVAQAICNNTEEAFTCYGNRQWQQAISKYQQLPDDGIQATFVGRCQQYLQQEPGDDWDGIYTLDSK